MNLTAAQSNEVQKTVQRLRTSTGWWNGDPRAREIIGQLVKDRDDARYELEEMKRSNPKEPSP